MAAARAQATPRSERARELGRGLVAFARRHWLILALVALALVLRVLVMVAYPPAFWFSDSRDYIQLSWEPHPSRLRPNGYPAVLMVLRHIGPLALVAFLQHVAGLAVAVGCYAFLLRRGVARGLASLAAVPLLFDSLQLDLEHFIATETLFTSLLVLGMGLLLWSDRPTVLVCAAAGLVLGAAWATRPVALGVVLLMGLYLLVRRVGWRRLATFALGFAVPYLLVIGWVGDRTSVYTSDSLGIMTFGRAAMVADCDRVELTAEQRALCPEERHDRVDAYTWQFLKIEQVMDPAYDPVLFGFSKAVIAAQPADYVGSIVREILPHFLPWQDLGPENRALAESWVLPASVRDTPNAPALAGPGFAAEPAPRAQAPAATPLTSVLHWYGRYVRTPALFNTAAVIIAAAALVRLRRRSQWPAARDAGVLVTVAAALVVAQVVFGMYEPRYGLPSLPLFAAGAVLAWHALRRREPDRAAGAQ